MNRLVLLSALLLAGPSWGYSFNPFLAVSNSGNDNTIYIHSLIDGSLVSTITTPFGPEGLDRPLEGLAGDLSGLIYFSNRNSLNTVTVDGVTTSQVGFFNGDTTEINGLAFDVVADKLYGVDDRRGIYEINPLTAQTTLILPVDSQDFNIGGFDIDPATGRAFVADDDTDGGLGVFEVTGFAGFTPVLSPYPNGLTDVDGLAAIDNFLYLVEDGLGESITRVHLDSGATQTWPVPFQASGNASGATLVDLPVDYTWIGSAATDHFNERQC